MSEISFRILSLGTNTVCPLCVFVHDAATDYSLRSVCRICPVGKNKVFSGMRSNVILEIRKLLKCLPAALMSTRVKSPSADLARRRFDRRYPSALHIFAPRLATNFGDEVSCEVGNKQTRTALERAITHIHVERRSSRKEHYSVSIPQLFSSSKAGIFQFFQSSSLTNQLRCVV